MSEEERKEFQKKMEIRRAEQKKIIVTELKNKIDKTLPQSEAESQLSEIDKALGLDNDDEMFMPDIAGF